MKSLTYILGLPVFILFASCGSCQKLQDESPVAIDEYYFQEWVAGARGAGSGINFTVALKEVPTTITMKDIYFRNMKTELQQGKQAPSVFTGYFKTNLNEPMDLTMNADPKKEYGNEAPKLDKKDMPFELQDNEAVISCEEDGKIEYYKLLNVQIRPSKMPAMKPQKVIG